MVKLTVVLRKFCLHRKKVKNEKEDSLKNGGFIRFDFATIRTATENFSVSNMLGEGGFGVVYKGTLKSGKQIAVKRLFCTELSTEVFMTETRVVARIHHTNLVKYLGLCLEGNDMLLVSEFFPNASLACLLFDHSKRILICWETWYKIILGIAKGIEYLHDGSGSYPTMLHYGLKTSNVLLDEEMNPKIADFGLNCKLFRDTMWPTSARFSKESAFGTHAYIAPEYLMTGWYSDKSDVYSFGVIVLEIVSDLMKGKSNQFYITAEHCTQARKLWDEDRLSELINPTLISRCSETEVIKCIQVGILCVGEDARHRPTMMEVVLMLTGKVEIPLPLAPVSP